MAKKSHWWYLNSNFIKTQTLKKSESFAGFYRFLRQKPNIRYLQTWHHSKTLPSFIYLFNVTTLLPEKKRYVWKDKIFMKNLEHFTSKNISLFFIFCNHQEIFFLHRAMFLLNDVKNICEEIENKDFARSIFCTIYIVSPTPLSTVEYLKQQLDWKISPGWTRSLLFLHIKTL